MIIETCAKNGGHLAPSLGVVELTIALHRYFQTPADKIVLGWDTRPTPTKSSPAAGTASAPCAPERHQRVSQTGRIAPRRL